MRTAMDRKPSGLTLPELVVGFSVFSIVMVLLAAALSRGMVVWERSFGGNTAQVELRKGYSSLLPDLQRTELQTVSQRASTSSFTGRDGDAVWFLSPWDQATSDVARTASGRPLWRANILYYCTVPRQHDAMYGATCSGRTDEDGYEVACPHKVLVRKVIKNPASSGPAEQALARGRIANYLTRPRRFDLPQGEPGLQDATIVATGLVTFRVTKDQLPEAPGEVAVRLAALGSESSRRTRAAGSAANVDAVRELHFSVFPPLRSEP